MQGTLRYNIDPMDYYSDEEIEESLKMIGFYYIIENDKLGLLQNVK